MNRLFDIALLVPRLIARGLVAVYRYTLSPLIGLNCRHLPTCSQFADEAFARHGLWAGGWMTLARLSRCHPFGTSGLDFVPAEVPPRAHWFLPWRYGRWSWRQQDGQYSYSGQPSAATSDRIIPAQPPSTRGD
jgi:putative membrane protein insertion efficiency factor